MALYLPYISPISPISPLYLALELGVGERVDYVAQRGETLQMQGGAGRCGEIQRRASGGLIRRALSRAWLIEIASLYLPINPYISLYLAISRYISLYLQPG